MRAAVIADNAVINIISADPSIDAAPDGCLLVSLEEHPEVSIGWSYDGAAFTPPEAPTPPVEVPQELTPRQLRLVLNAYGALDAVEGYVAQQVRAVQLAWQYATIFKRDDQLLNTGAQHMGITQDQIDQWFIEGAVL